MMKAMAQASSDTWVLPPLSFSAVSSQEQNGKGLGHIKMTSLTLRISLQHDLTLNYIDLGAAYGTAKSGVGICSMGVLKPDLIFKSIVPIIMAGILGIYGLIVAVILNGKGMYTSYLRSTLVDRIPGALDQIFSI